MALRCVSSVGATSRIALLLRLYIGLVEIHQHDHPDLHGDPGQCDSLGANRLSISYKVDPSSWAHFMKKTRFRVAFGLVRYP